jgi:hypothetical protein
VLQALGLLLLLPPLGLSPPLLQLLLSPSLPLLPHLLQLS